MEKVVVWVVTLALIALLVGCNNTKTDTNDTTAPTAETTEPMVERPNDSISNEADASDSKENNDAASDLNNTVGAVDAGNQLISPYSPYVDGVVWRKGTFSENYAQYMRAYDEMEGKWEYNRPAVMYHLACEMNLTREDLEVYYTALGYDNVPENIYSGLLADTLEESMQLLKSEYAFYNNGKLYTLYDVYQLDNENSLAFNINDDVYDSVWQSIDAYLKTPTAVDVGDDMREYVNQKVNTTK